MPAPQPSADGAAASSRFIAGIYNYCNRRCGRCRFTGRCRLYAEQSPPGLGTGGPAGVALQLLAMHPLNLRAQQLTRDIHAFLDDLALEAGQWGASRVVGRCREALGHQSILAASKIYRAVSGRRAERTREWACEDAWRDADGSAKVAYLGLEACQRALGTLARLYPAQRGIARDLVARTQRLMTSVDDAFPGHVSFRRPGFDG